MSLQPVGNADLRRQEAQSRSEERTRRLELESQQDRSAVLDLAGMCLYEHTFSAVQAEQAAGSIHNKMIALRALTILFHPLYDLSMKNRRLRVLAGDPQALLSFANSKENHGQQEDELCQLTNTEKRYGDPLLRCFKRNNGCGSSKFEQQVPSTLLEATPLPQALIPTIMQYLDPQREVFIMLGNRHCGFDIPESCPWAFETFQLKRFECAYFGKTLKQDQKFSSDFDLWMPDVDQDFILCSSGSTRGKQWRPHTGKEGPLNIEYLDYSEPREQRAILKSFNPCTREETAEILARLWRGKDRLQPQGCSQFLPKGIQPRLVKIVNSPTVNCVAFQDERTPLVRIQGMWVERQAEVVKAKAAKEEQENGVPNQVIHLNDGSSLDLTRSPPSFVCNGKSFTTEPVEWQKVGVSDRQPFVPNSWVKDKYEFTAISSVLLHPDEEQAAFASLPLPRPLVELVRAFADMPNLSELTLPRQLLTAAKKA